MLGRSGRRMPPDSVAAMLAAHATLGIVTIVAAAVAAVWGGIAYRRGRPAGRLLSNLLALAQTLLVAQVGLGLLLLSDDRRSSDELHYAYGTLALAAVLAPWLYAPLDARRRLAWFSGATLVAAALAVRAYVTGV
jgi:ABC-type proline/glycine betaine transport system permease subunit